MYYSVSWTHWTNLIACRTERKNARARLSFLVRARAVSTQTGERLPCRRHHRVSRDRARLPRFRRFELVQVLVLRFRCSPVVRSTNLRPATAGEQRAPDAVQTVRSPLSRS